MSTATTTSTRALIALDIDGTLVDSEARIPAGTVEALDLVRAAGHEVVLASGRSLTGLLPIATRLGLTHGWAVCSNGALTVRLDRSTPSGYVVVETRTFDAAPVLRRALDLAPVVRVAVEEVGWGWRTSGTFEPGELNGQQKTVLLADLVAEPATRVALAAPGIRRYTDALRASGVTVAPQSPDWLDVTAPGVNKAVALDTVRAHLRIPAGRTVAAGDGVNDLDMLAWAARSVAMGQAPAIVRSAANETTSSIGQAGLLPVLASLVPAVDRTLPRLAAQIATAERTAPGPVVQGDRQPDQGPRHKLHAGCLAIRTWHRTGRHRTAHAQGELTWQLHGSRTAGSTMTVRRRRTMGAASVGGSATAIQASASGRSRTSSRPTLSAAATSCQRRS